MQIGLWIYYKNGLLQPRVVRTEALLGSFLLPEAFLPAAVVFVFLVPGQLAQILSALRHFLLRRPQQALRHFLLRHFLLRHFLLRSDCLFLYEIALLHCSGRRRKEA